MNSQGSAATASTPAARFDACSLRAKIHWSVAEAAFMVGLGERSVWRLLADPRSGFPKARRIGRRTLLSAAEVMAFAERTAKR